MKQMKLDKLKCVQMPKSKFKILKRCAFRKMTKINGKLNKRPVKRLQAGPKLADSSNLQLDKGIALEKLVGRLVGESMEVTMSKAKERYLRNENMKNTTGHAAAG